MKFPNDIKLAMRDCILKILWSKSDIVNFFKNNGCTNNDLKCISGYKEMHRNEIIDALFTHLDSKTDEGLAQYRSMMQSLINWSQFDPYYFDNIKKLNRKDAESAISHLKQLQEIRDARIKEQRTEREIKQQLAMQASMTIKELHNQFIALMQGKVDIQKRGYELEKLLQELAKTSSLEVTEPFKVLGEQIDGAIKFEGEHYIIEAKWQEMESSNEPVYQFAHKVDGKMYGRGLFISINGFSENVVKSLVVGKVIRTILIDGFDISIVLEGFLSFTNMLDAKIKAAQTMGLIYIDPTNGKSKIPL
jgi:hypothetical protein